MKRFKILLATIIILTAIAMRASGQEFYSNKTIRIVVGFSPGGGMDIYARAIGRHLGKKIGKAWGVPISAIAMRASGQEFYSNKTIRIVVGFSPGGGMDIYARAIGRHLGK